MSEVIVFGYVVLALALVGLVFFTRLRLRMIALALLGVAAALICGVFLLSHLLDRSLQKRNGPRHVFDLSSRPGFLTEELALDKARAALAQDGYANVNWQPVPESRTSAPDGRSEVYFRRDLNNPNHGFLIYSNAQDQRFFVDVQLNGDHVVCQRIRPK